jgi:hypothetical protein
MNEGWCGGVVIVKRRTTMEVGICIAVKQPVVHTFKKGEGAITFCGLEDVGDMRKLKVIQPSDITNQKICQVCYLAMGVLAGHLKNYD